MRHRTKAWARTEMRREPAVMQSSCEVDVVLVFLRRLLCVLCGAEYGQGELAAQHRVHSPQCKLPPTFARWCCHLLPRHRVHIWRLGISQWWTPRIPTPAPFEPTTHGLARFRLALPGEIFEEVWGQRVHFPGPVVVSRKVRFYRTVCVRDHVVTRGRKERETYLRLLCKPAPLVGL